MSIELLVWMPAWGAFSYVVSLLWDRVRDGWRLDRMLNHDREERLAWKPESQQLEYEYGRQPLQERFIMRHECATPQDEVYKRALDHIPSAFSMTAQEIALMPLEEYRHHRKELLRQMRTMSSGGR